MIGGGLAIAAIYFYPVLKVDIAYIPFKVGGKGGGGQIIFLYNDHLFSNLLLPKCSSLAKATYVLENSQTWPQPKRIVKHV